MALIDAAGAFALLERVVAERGTDYVYHAPEEEGPCLYVHDGNPSCGVGLAAAFAGVDLDVLRSWDAYELPTIDEVPQGYFDRNAVQVLDAFQMTQDSEWPYGHALADAREVLQNLQSHGRPLRLRHRWSA